MGAERSSLVKVKKGVEYLKTTNEVHDCLFCRIVHGESEINQLWYADDLCALFVPRSPAARLHFLITPLEHIRTINELTKDHLPLLEHIREVALEQLRVHSELASSKLQPLAHPPTYKFNRGKLNNDTENTMKETTSNNDHNFIFCFHAPPYNSIDHLHLHAIYKPFVNLWSSIQYSNNKSWCKSLEHVIRDLKK
ncbi:unnamed protein product [Didymodactylos carnosus]|uniref:Adenosine 5'-monophosphoramidase HINT3 n=1 Tax=Didymodactylos carnosus TaxID=1234261 RepID=A0A815CXB3_9BILA|nr:unnamed protein product [Didymodactylos carnosus]CAF1288646.1 unnamed protein product [Didymodactylos carnosus]CAF3869618.1 unnamed protein product [Didymodactylos carnosus]CAF4092651.1 unnamed protein product [Didymodactylos carnosus]